MRPLYPNLKVYAFATPGNKKLFYFKDNLTETEFFTLILAGLLSREAARVAEEFTFTVGVGDDMVMHMTINNVEDLRTNMVQVLQLCRLPKVIHF